MTDEDAGAVDGAAMEFLPPGTMFAGHVVEELIGRGGMGVVYRARHRGLGRLVALKLIAPELAHDATIRRRFVREVATAASVEHAHIVPVHDAGEAAGIAYMAMRHVDGVDLRTLVRDHGPLEPARAAEIVAKIGDALDAVHRAGYLHRDVKPRNVFIEHGGHVYLGDFGLARRPADCTRVTGTGHWVGTVDYVAPEQIRGDRLDARADVYGLGGLLCFAVTGRAPFQRADDLATLWAHLNEPPPIPSRSRAGMSRSVDAIVARALAKQPADRFASAGELGRAALRATRRHEAATVTHTRTAVADCRPGRQTAAREWTRW